MSELSTYSRLIKDEALRLGFNGVGIAAAGVLTKEAVHLENWLEKGYHAGLGYMERNTDLRTDPSRLVEGARSVICVFLNYYPQAVQSDPYAPVLSKYAYGKDYHSVMKGMLKSLLNFTVNLIPGTTGRVFTDSAPVLEHAWASLSGLGWIGKNSLLLTQEYGSFVFLGEMIITSELEYDRPVNDLCGSCRNCITSCPTGAIVAERTVDAGKCISYHTIENKTQDMPESLKDKFMNRVFGCDICQDVCPWNRTPKSHHLPELNPPPGLLKMSRDDWYSLDEAQFHSIFKGSAVKRAGFKGIERNLRFLAHGPGSGIPDDSD